MLAGKGNLQLEMEDGQTIMDAFLRVIKLNPVLKPHWLDKKGQPQIYVHVYLNGDDVMTLPKGLNTKVSDGDCIDFIPPVAGG